MRNLGFLLVLCPLALVAQPAEGDARTLQALLTEVQQLRVAIERSTLLGTRTQLAISQLQLQESKADRLGKELNDVRTSRLELENHKRRISGAVKEFESKLTQPEYANPKGQGDLTGEIKGLKMELESVGAREQAELAREGELTSQFQAAQRQVQDSRSWISQMQQSLDTAIQQMLKPR